MKMKMMREAVLGAAMCVVGTSAFGAPLAKERTLDVPSPYEEVRVRTGAGNFLEKLKAGKDVTIAYLGGSITSQKGWRVFSAEWLQKEYPQAKIHSVDAAIGGTDSSLGVFRVDHDALAYKPDLLFVEFGCNDHSIKGWQSVRAMEGIVRQAWKSNPRMDIVFVYTITGYMQPWYKKGNYNPPAANMELLADFYGIPSICFGARVIELVKQNKLVMSLGEVPTAVVPQDQPDRMRIATEKLAAEGKILFAQDGVHPGTAGHKVYLESIVKGFTAMKDMAAMDHGSKLAEVFVADNLENARMVPIQPEMLHGACWHKLSEKNPRKIGEKGFAHRMGVIWEADEPGAELNFKFKGTYCQIYDLLGPDGCFVEVTVDGQKLPKPVARCDGYCTYYRLSTLKIYDGVDGVHAVSIRILKEQPDRQMIAKHYRLKPEAVKTPRYDGTGFRPGAIHIVGEIVK